VDTPTNPPVRFGVFELDERAGELRRSGRRVALQPQPLEILRALLERPGEVVTREELRRRVWKNGAYLDFDRSLNKAIVKLRDALGDDADSPRYIETLPRHGYRFISLPHAHVDAAPREQGALTADMPQPEGPPSPQISPVLKVQSAGVRQGLRWAAMGLTLLALAGWLISSRFPMEAPSHPAPAPNLTPAAAVAFAPPPHSIAVLPFLNMSGDPSQEYFSDGLTEELLNSLSRINELQVAARTSSFSFQGEHPDITTVAHKLNVASVLEGSVRRSGHTVRVTAQLNNTMTGFHIWSQTYDRDLGDVLKLQTEIATAVASALKVALLGDEDTKIELGGTRDPAAFDAYLRGLKAFNARPVSSSYQTAIAAYTEAIRLDPNYALAFAGRASALTEYAGFATGAAIGDSLERAQADAREALYLAPELAEGQLALARYFSNSLDFARAGEAFQRALSLAPGNAQVLGSSGRFVGRLGHFDGGLAAGRHAVALDPLNPRIHGLLAATLYLARRYEEAIAAYRDIISLDPDVELAYARRGLAYYGLGDFQNARSSCETKPAYWGSQWCLAVTYDKLGQHAEAEAALKKLQAVKSDAGAFYYAMIYAQWGNTPSAIEWLVTAKRLNNGDLIDMKSHPLLDPIRQELRFQTIERELKFPN
jgi:TolB-like protein/DNA-binding winged helix-turn-helix (wHTH) protein/Tfp pilus assembly protein PilF